jgi:hypothetical protein
MCGWLGSVLVVVVSLATSPSASDTTYPPVDLWSRWDGSGLTWPHPSVRRGRERVGNKRISVFLFLEMIKMCSFLYNS